MLDCPKLSKYKEYTGSFYRHRGYVGLGFASEILGS